MNARLLLVSGRVQGVGYRAACAAAARRLGLSGWVRNRSDGTVELLACGADDQLDALLAWCHTGPPAASVRSVVAAPCPPPSNLVGFRVETTL